MGLQPAAWGGGVGRGARMQLGACDKEVLGSNRLQQARLQNLWASLLAPRPANHCQ